MRLMLEQDDDLQCNYPIQCICGDEETVNTTVNVFPVHDKANHISNFVLLIEDRRESSEIEAKLEAAKKESAMLMTQLIPREAEAFLADKEEDFAFSANSITVVTVQILDATVMVNDPNDSLDELFGQIENIAKAYPPFIKVKTLFDTSFFVGGLFSEDTTHAKIAVEFAKNIRNELSKELPDTGKPRFEVAIMTGGPLICGLESVGTHKSFEVIGQILDQTFELQISAPPDSIIMTESTKALLTEQDFEGVTEGPPYLQQNTYVFN
ncbi:guanylate cyclase [Tritrichomonas foetus]|uniref:Guanylate cyclase n=1 Tax=Tritrichomonas foetus TaxID=1144522 RepID=A0A1J4L628_9EUKA|nr:guanylate cyclase [Tritrichomonas foetus]|eukprot:OHT17468.1 guanylate cyclase [Tritrichomonas foetus]